MWPWSGVTKGKQKWKLSDPGGWGKILRLTISVDVGSSSGLCWESAMNLWVRQKASTGNEGPEAYIALQENRTYDYYKLDTKEHLECEKTAMLISNIVVLLNFFFFFIIFLAFLRHLLLYLTVDLFLSN